MASKAIEEGSRILVLASGFRGDVQPLLFLACRLQALRHTIRMLTSVNFIDLCTEHAIDAVPVYPDLKRVSEMVEGVSHDSQAAKLAIGTEVWKGANPGVLVEPMTAIRDFRPDLTVANTQCYGDASRYEHETGVPAVYVTFCKIYAALDHTNHVPSTPPRPSFLTSSPLLDLQDPMPNMPPGMLHLGAWVSRAETPSPAALPSSPLKDLEAFLEAGPAPVALGWGSLIAEGLPPRAMLMLALQALSSAQRRGVIIGGWAHLDRHGKDLAQNSGAWGKGDSDCGVIDPDTILTLAEFARSDCFFISSVPHHWLFTKCSCIVHHGGGGTTHAALSAGKPAVITPIICDQFLWSKRVNELGVGIGFEKPLPRIASQEIADAILKAESLTSAAEAMGAQLRAEPGVSGAACVLDYFVRGPAQTYVRTRECQCVVS